MKTKQQNGSKGFFVPLVITIVVIFIFGAGVYAYLQSDKNPQVVPGVSIFPQNNNTENSTTSVASTSDINSISTNANAASNCGFKVTSHVPNQAVSFPIIVKGIIDNTEAENKKCSWSMFEGQAGTAQLYYDVNPVTFNSEKWVSIGQSVPINADKWMALQTNFSVSLGNDQMALQNGTRMKIVFTEEDPSGMGKVDSLELPLIISNNMNNLTLSEKDILGAVYSISMNFNGKKIAPQFVQFPPKTGSDASRLTDVVYLYPYNNAGLIDVTTNSPKEAFWIYKYEFTDESHKIANVYVGGNFGASGQDNRIFIVKKVDGEVVTTENK